MQGYCILCLRFMFKDLNPCQRNHENLYMTHVTWLLYEMFLTILLQNLAT